MEQVTGQLREAATHHVTTRVLPQIADTVQAVDRLTEAYQDPPRQLGNLSVQLRQEALRIPDEMADQLAFHSLATAAGDTSPFTEFNFTGWKLALNRLRTNLNLLGAPNGPKKREDFLWSEVSTRREAVQEKLANLQTAFEPLNE